MGTAMTAEHALSLREKAQERFEQLESEMKAGQSDPEAWEMARRTVEFYARQTEILKVKEAEEAERQAQLKLEQKLREKARADLPVLEKKLMLTENVRAALIDLHDAFPGPHEDPVKFALAVFVDTYLPEVRGGPGRGALDKVRHQVLTSTAQRGQVEALRKEIAEAKEVLAATNGSPTKGSSK